MNTGVLISALSQSLRPVRHLAFARICGEWLTVTVASFAAIALLYGFRTGLAGQLATPLFAIEMALNILLIVAAGLMAVSLAYPDRASVVLLRPLLANVFTFYSGIALVTALRDPGVLDSVENTAPHGLACLMCIVSFAAIPALWMLWRLRALAITRPMQTGFAALLMATATGSLGVRLVETEIAPSGLIVWHYLPLLALSGLGVYAGNRIFRW